MTSEVTRSDRDARRSAALLKAVGLDRVPPEQREIALAIAKRYDLDLLLKHLVLVDGRPYITRDGLLHVAHRSGQLDGIEVSDPELVDMPGQGQFWRATAAVFRRDMTRPFRYAGRYPARGGNNPRFAPEMAVKVAEVMALRRAFDVSAPVIEERWDMAQPPERGLRELVAERTEQMRAAEPPPGETELVVDGPQASGPVPSPGPEAPPLTGEAGLAGLLDTALQAHEGEDGPASPEQRAALKVALWGLSQRQVLTVLSRWGLSDLAAIEAGQAQAILDVAAAIGGDLLRERWRDLASAGGMDPIHGS